MESILDNRKDNFKEKFYYLIENYDLWVWDFDLTLTKIHTYKQKLDSYLVGRKKQRDLENDFYDATFFINLVNFLILNDKKVAIVSFGTYNVIKTYLERLFGDSYIFNSNNILTPLSGDSRYGEKIPHPPDNKNQMLKNLSQSYQIDLTRTIFFDDTPHNIYQAKQLGLMAVNIPRGEGFNSTYLESVEDKFRKLLDQGQIVSMTCPKKKDNIEPAFTHSATRFREGDILPDFRDDLEGNTITDFYDKEQLIGKGVNNFDNWTRNQKVKLGIEGINLPLEKDLSKDDDIEPHPEFVIEGFENYTEPKYWLWLQQGIEIIALCLLAWFLYSKYSS